MWSLLSDVIGFLKSDSRPDSSPILKSEFVWTENIKNAQRGRFYFRKTLVKSDLLQDNDILLFERGI